MDNSKVLLISLAKSGSGMASEMIEDVLIEKFGSRNEVSSEMAKLLKRESSALTDTEIQFFNLYIGQYKKEWGNEF